MAAAESPFTGWDKLAPGDEARSPGFTGEEWDQGCASNSGLPNIFRG